jgi:hypothetical protein
MKSYAGEIEDKEASNLSGQLIRLFDKKWRQVTKGETDNLLAIFRLGQRKASAANTIT